MWSLRIYPRAASAVSLFVFVLFLFLVKLRLQSSYLEGRGTAYWKTRTPGGPMRWHATWSKGGSTPDPHPGLPQLGEAGYLKV